MYNSTFWSEVIKSLVWPVTIIFLLFLFKNSIKKLIDRIDGVKLPWIEFHLGDTILPPSSLPPVTPEPHVKEQEPIKKAEVQKVSLAEQEASRKSTQARLDEDTKRAGYQRGTLFQLDNGTYAIAWHAEATVRIGVK